MCVQVPCVYILRSASAVTACNSSKRLLPTLCSVADPHKIWLRKLIRIHIRNADPESGSLVFTRIYDFPHIFPKRKACSILLYYKKMIKCGFIFSWLMHQRFLQTPGINRMDPHSIGTLDPDPHWYFGLYLDPHETDADSDRWPCDKFLEGLLTNWTMVSDFTTGGFPISFWMGLGRNFGKWDGVSWFI